MVDQDRIIKINIEEEMKSAYIDSKEEHHGIQVDHWIT